MTPIRRTVAGMWDDLFLSLRVLRRFKIYTFAAVVTLGLGIGAATAVFSVIDATLLRPLPYRDPDRLVALNSTLVDPTGAEQPFPLSHIELLAWRASTTLESIDAVETRTVALTGRGDPEVVDAGAATSGFFRTLGVEPAIGRMFTADEERAGAAVAVLSYALWSTRFSASPSAVGETITLEGRPHQIIGVLPRDFRLLFDRSVVWTPLNPVVDPARQNNRLMFAVGRLRPHATAAQAQADLATLSAPLAKQWPLSHGRAKPTVQLLHEKLFGARAPALWMLAVAVLGLLALACANVANLTLGHLSTRQGELATRALLGAGPVRILRMLVVQTGVLATLGGLLAVAAVAFVLPPLVALYNGGGTGVVTLGLDWRVLIVSCGVVGGATLLCAAVPVWKIHRASRRGETLRMAGARVSAGRSERLLRATLVSAQVGIAVALLCVSGTLMKSLDAVLSTAPGFAADHVLTMQMMLPPAIYPDVPARSGFVRRMLERVRQVPGVVAAATTQSTFLPAQSMFTFMHVEGITVEQPDLAHIRHITPGYFDALRVPVVEGRAIDARDQPDAPMVCVVSRAFARKYFSNGGALGHRVRRAGQAAAWMTIVGVAGDVRDAGLASEPGPTLYVAYYQRNTPTARVSLVARTHGDPEQMANSIRQAIWEVDRNQPIDRIASLEHVFSEGASAERFRTLLVGLFAVVGFVLAIVGVYAVTSASVTARTWEASIRLALGARPMSVAVNLLREASLPIGIGVALGIGAFVLLARLLAQLLFQTSATDPSVIVAAAGALTVCALAAAAWQSRRLAAVSPALGLQGDLGR